MSGLSSGQTLRSSTSSRLPSSSSLISNAQPTAHRSDNRSPVVTSTASLENHGSSPLEDGPIGTHDNVYDSHKELGHKRHKLRHSGGFLLQSASVQGSQAAVERRTNLENSQDVNGKRRAADEDLLIPKRRTVSRRYYNKPIVGSSPLATEVRHDASIHVTHGKDGFSQDDILPLPSSTRSSLHHETDGNGTTSSAQLADNHESRQKAPSAIGYGTDPAQIVNLALNLNESRRRQLSMGNSPPMNFGNRRIPSLAQHSTGSPNSINSGSGNGSLRYYLHSQRHASRNISPRSSRLQARDVSSSSSPRVGGSNAQHITTSTFDPSVTHETLFVPSNATLARAEKARIAFSLSYEYRRLLPNLPALSTYANSKPMSSSSSAKSIINREDFGRVYNPLQYIRNRKIRYRRGKMLDSEADGWMNVDQVKQWIDSIASNREAGTSSLDLHYVLSPFRGTRAEPNMEDPMIEPSRHTGLPSNRWSFTPWDLLADAYWVHQDDNIKFIEDRDHRKLIPSPATPSRNSKDFASSPVRRSESSTRQNFTPERIQSLLKPGRNNSRERGRRRLHPHESKPSVVNSNSSRDRRSRWPRKPIRSRSSSSSYESYDDGLRGHLRDSGYFRGRDPESAALEKQMREMLKKEFENDALPDITDTKINDNCKIDEVKKILDKKLLTSSASMNGDSKQVQNWRDVDYGRLTSDKSRRSPRGSLDEGRDVRIRHSLDQPVNSALNHVHGQNNIPSIAVDSSSAITQNTGLKKDLPAWLSSHQRNLSKERHAIGERDFENGPKEPKSLAQQKADEANNQDSPSKDRIMTIGNSLLSPTAAQVLGRRFRRPDGASARSAGDLNDPESRLRGFFKGGRIAELVGNEVHKVGGKIWKKESMNNLSRVSTKSGYASDVSDLEADLSGLDSSPENRISRVTTKQEEYVQQMQKPATTERPKHINHLSSFNSETPKQNQSSDTLDTSWKDDHISRQQVAQRIRGRSSRFDRLAPPKINVERVSRKLPAQNPRTQTRDTDISYSESRQSSGSGPGTPLYAADKRLNLVLGTPGIAGSSGGPPVSILSSLESHQHRTSSRPGVEQQRQWSISDRGVSAVRGTVTKRDIARIQALLLSSGIKANEIVRRGQEVRESPSALLQSLEQMTKRPLPQVPRSQEHLLAAQISIASIESSNRQLRDDAEHFSTKTIEALHEQIRAIDEHVALKLTPAVRAAADEADDFSTQLTTTYTLAVKELNDSVNVLLRRRGRRFRWMRRAGYVLLEWALLGLMWWVWLIVIIVLLCRGTIRGFVKGVRWLLWL